MRLCLVDPYTVPVRDMVVADRLNDALTARQRAHLYRRLSRKCDGFTSRSYARQATQAFAFARDMIAAGLRSVLDDTVRDLNAERAATDATTNNLARREAEIRKRAWEEIKPAAE